MGSDILHTSFHNTVIYIKLLRFNGAIQSWTRNEDFARTSYRFILPYVIEDTAEAWHST